MKILQKSLALFISCSLSAVFPGKVGQGASIPFDGYYVRRVSPDTEVTDGNVVFVAYPAEYRSSGVMTFIITAE